MIIELLSSSSQNSLFFSFMSLFFSDVSLLIFVSYCNSFLRVIYPRQYAWILTILRMNFSYSILVNLLFLYFYIKHYLRFFIVDDFLWPYGDIFKLCIRDFYGVLLFDTLLVYLWIWYTLESSTSLLLSSSSPKYIGNFTFLWLLLFYTPLFNTYFPPCLLKNYFFYLVDAFNISSLIFIPFVEYSGYFFFL